MQNEVLNYCLEKGMLVDKDVLNLFSETSDVESVKLLIERIKNYTNQRVINKELFNKNKDKVSKAILSLPEEKRKNAEGLRSKLGLSLEISDENEEKETEDKNDYEEEEGGKVIPSHSVGQDNRKLDVADFTNYFKKRFNEMKNILQEHSELENLVSLSKISGDRKGISIIGMVSNKRVTKNNNILLDVEDSTGMIRVLINKDKEEVYKKAENLALDSVVGFKGSGNREIFFANDVIFPEAAKLEKKKSPKQEYALFIGDLHFGSKKFLEKGFDNFINYLNGNVPGTEEEVKKIKYLFMVGDIVTGVGNYPDQDKDLVYADLEEQFMELSKYLDRIRKDIKIIISPGNHDGVRIMEPQPFLDKKFAWPLHELENVIITENPCLVNIGSRKGFKGFDVLTYHGFSFPYYANNISDLISKQAMNSPEEIMKFLLKHRHLAPTHGSTQYYPLEKDELIIRNVPDIFVAAHTHKCSVSSYNNISIISISCWEAMTSYQEKMGNKPDHCKVPMFDLKTGSIKILDFEDTEETKRLNKLK